MRSTQTQTHTQGDRDTKRYSHTQRHTHTFNAQSFRYRVFYLAPLRLIF